jgi:TatD DNase family protein
MWIDTHTHQYFDQFDEDREAAMQRAFDRGVNTFFLPNVDSKSIERLLDLESSYPGKVFAMMGLHPCSVKDDYEEELRVVESWLNRRDFCAIGEIGIDLYWDKTHFEEQKKAFLTQVGWAKEREKPIVIHCRESLDIVLELLQPEKEERLRGIFHCFTGTVEQAQAVMDLGFYLGIGGVLTYKNAGLDKIMESVPLDRLVLETDAPFLAPVPYRGKRNESAYIPIIGARLADIKGVAVEEIALKTSANAQKIFGYPTK